MAPTDGNSHGERLKQLLQSDGNLRPEESAEVVALITEDTKITKGVLMKYGADEITAEELAGIAIERAIVLIGQYQPVIAKFSTWVTRIALNLLSDKKRKHLLPETGYSDIDISEQGGLDENIEILFKSRSSKLPDYLQAVLDALSETDRTLIIYTVKYSDVLYLEHFEISEDAFRQRKSRALRNFKTAYVRINGEKTQTNTSHITKTQIRN